MESKTIQYANIRLESVNPSDMIALDTGDTEIKYDYFDSMILDKYDSLLYFFRICKQTEFIGYVTLYNLDLVNQTANVYGKIIRKCYYGDFIKALLALLKYAFSAVNLKKLNLVYRQDNYFFDDVCKHLNFIREGLLRGQMNCQGKLVDVNTYGMLDYEYQRYATSVYKRMFAWDYSFDPKSIVLLNLTDHFNRRLFTNSIDNPNHAWINDWYREYVMNRTIPKGHCLTYKNVKFPVCIFNPDLEFDCFLCGRQEISVPEGRYTDLLLVTTAQFGNKQTYITAVYEDGTGEECEFSVGDWCEKIVRNEHVIHYAAACRNLGWRSNMIKCDAFIYLQRVHINHNKALRKLIFPQNNDIFIFAGALCGINPH